MFELVKLYWDKYFATDQSGRSQAKKKTVTNAEQFLI